MELPVAKVLYPVLININKNKICKIFDDYTSHYDASDGMVKLKIIHTKNVANNCEQIAKTIKIFDNDDIQLAWLIGMLHDIGRFEQIKRYGTFRDEKSIDHAQFGIELLYEEDLLKHFVDIDKETAEIIRVAIANHNKLKIEDGLNPRQLEFAKIIRDADKLDIFRVCAQDPSIDVYGATKDEIENSNISDSVYKLAMSKKGIPYTIRYTLADDIVCHLALLWDLNYDVSVDIAKQQGYFKQMQDFNFKDIASRKKYQDIVRLLK